MGQYGFLHAIGLIIGMTSVFVLTGFAHAMTGTPKHILELQQKANIYEAMLRAQSDLDEAGFPLSISLIVLLNGLLLLAAVKCLFPRVVSFADGMRQTAAITLLFWGGIWGFCMKGVVLARSWR